MDDQAMKRPVGRPPKPIPTHPHWSKKEARDRIALKL